MLNKRKQKKSLKELLTGFLKQGMTCQKLALTVALGITIGTFPVIGPTTLMCLAIALILKLNIPAIQAANYISSPLQIIFLLPQYQIGAYLFGSGSFLLGFDEFMALATEDFLKLFDTLMWSTVYAIYVWCMTAPFLGGIIYLLSFWIIKRISDKMSRGNGAPGADLLSE